MDVLRTPDARFADLPDFDFEPRYLDVPAAEDGSGRLRMAWVEAGPADGEPILCLHGEPSWSYLYRKMLPLFAKAGFRAIAPDLVGFGRSDKPVDPALYTYASHLGWLGAWIRGMGLEGIHLVCQDWGGLLGLRILTADPDRFATVTVANTFLPTGTTEMPEAFLRWRDFSQNVPEFPAGDIVQRATVNELPEAVVAAYDAPFPDERFKAGARRFPVLVPASADEPEAVANLGAWAVLRTWRKPMLTAFSDSDPIMRGGDRVFQSQVPGCAGQPHVTIEGGGHFLQEDQGEALAEAVLRFLAGVEGNR
ncbi:MAG: haloalkane dehalogenase [Acidobacteriota bacterium]